MRTRQGLWAAAVVAALLMVAPTATAQPDSSYDTISPTETTTAETTSTETTSPPTSPPETTVAPTEPTTAGPCDPDASVCPVEPCYPAESDCTVDPCEHETCSVDPTLEVPDTVKQGATLTISGDRWPCTGVQIVADWLESPVDAVANGGSFAQTLDVGDDVTPGEHMVSASQSDCRFGSVRSGVVMVVATGTPPPPPPPTTTTSQVILVPPVVEQTTVSTVEPAPAPATAPAPDPEPAARHVPLWLFLVLGVGMLAAIRRVVKHARRPATPVREIDVVGHLDPDPQIRVDGDHDDTTTTFRLDAHAGPTVTTLHREQQ